MSRRTASPEVTLSWDGRLIEGKEIRALAEKGGPAELTVRFQPRISTASEGTLTGLDPAFLPRGVEFDLTSVRRRGEECIARYCVRKKHR